MVDDAGQQNRVWVVREAALAATAHIPDWPDTHAGWEDTLVIANGFSCREQIEQGTGRATLHVAQLLARKIRGV